MKKYFPQIAISLAFTIAFYLWVKWQDKKKKEARLLNPDAPVDTVPVDAVKETRAATQAEKVFGKSAGQSAKQAIAGAFPLSRGSRGENVRKLQRALGITVDGVFGPKTELALFKQTGAATITESQYQNLSNPLSVIGRWARNN